MTSRRFPGLALGLLLTLGTISTGCAARGADRDEVPHSSRDQFTRQLEQVDERIERLEELSGDRAGARAAVLVQRRAEVARRLEELDEEAPTFAADRQMLEDDLFQLEADVATLQRDLLAPVRSAQVQPAGQPGRPVPPAGRVLTGATGG